MNRTSGGRPNTVRQREFDHAGSGARTASQATAVPVAGLGRRPLPTRVSDLPALSAEYAATLDAGLSSLALELPLAVRLLIDDHVRLLLAWTEAINLTAIREPAAVAREHVLDSLSALPLLQAREIDGFLDLGSGGGFPGLPIALALPARRALLVDSVAKKARFLTTATVALGVGDRIRVSTRRAEALAADRRHRAAWPAVLARAVAPLAELAELALPLLGQGGVLVAWKRLPLDDDLARAVPAIAAVGGGSPEIGLGRVPGLEDHAFVVVTKIRPTEPAYPRSPAERKRRPW